MDLFDRFREVRLENGWTQETLADILGMSKTGISSIETRRAQPSLQTIERLSRQTEVNIDWLLTGRGPKYWDEEEEGIDWELLEAVIDAVERTAAEEGLGLPPLKKARLIRMIFEEQMAREKPARSVVDEEKARRLVTLVGEKKPGLTDKKKEA